jgi:hypothetical protein
MEILWESVMNYNKNSFNNGKKRLVCRYSDDTDWTDRGLDPGRGKELSCSRNSPDRLCCPSSIPGSGRGIILNTHMLLAPKL